MPSTRRETLFEKQRGKCFYCPTMMNLGEPDHRKNPTACTVEHQIPKSRGGHGRRGNTVAACLRCNHIKGSMTAEEFVRLHSPHSFPPLSRTRAPSRIEIAVAQANVPILPGGDRERLRAALAVLSLPPEDASYKMGDRFPGSDSVCHEIVNKAVALFRETHP